MYIRRTFWILTLMLALASSAAAQGAPFGAPALGKVVVLIRETGGARISTPAWVRLYADASIFEYTSNAEDNARVIFDNVPLGEYNVEVRAPGYVAGVFEVSLLTANSIAYVNANLRVESGSKASTAAAGKSGPPVMAPKARKELEQAGQALRANDLKKAQDHLDIAKKLAPAHPDIFYLQGLIYFEQQDAAKARASLEAAINIYPSHAGALASLGAVLYRLGNYADAVTSLEKSVEIAPQNWQSHRALAMCHIRLRTYDKARSHAERAIEIAGDKTPELHVLLARILIALNEKEKARAELQLFITANPGHAEFAEAQRLLATLLGEVKGSSTAKPETTPGPSSNSGANSEPAMAGVVVSTALETRTGSGSWAPPAVDDTPPVLLKNTSCNLQDVLTGTGKRAVALVQNLERITATENVEQNDLDEVGNLTRVRTYIFNYLVSIIEIRPGNLSVEEDRLPITKSVLHSHDFITRGLGAMALIFHPYYTKDYEMRCEGLTEVQGQPAWSIHFRQRADMPSRIYQYTLEQGSFSIPLKGRAWIAANNFQVLRLETDLVEPMKKLRLELEHLVIEYQPVDFKTRNIRLWLPANAERYAFFRGQRSLHHHSFTDYKVFSVDVTQKVGEVKTP